MQQFRKACPEDFDEIVALFVGARAYIAGFGIDQWQNGSPSNGLLQSDINQGIGYVLWDNGIAAYGVLIFSGEPAYDERPDAWRTAVGEYATVHRFAVADAYRRTGAGTVFLHHLEQAAREAGMKSLRADTHRGNVAMNAFMKRNGYADCGLVDYRNRIRPPFDPIRVGYEKML